jgi:hypothetical protein
VVLTAIDQSISQLSSGKHLFRVVIKTTQLAKVKKKNKQKKTNQTNKQKKKNQKTNRRPDCSDLNRASASNSLFPSFGDL